MLMYSYHQHKTLLLSTLCWKEKLGKDNLCDLSYCVAFR